MEVPLTNFFVRKIKQPCLICVYPYTTIKKSKMQVARREEEYKLEVIQGTLDLSATEKPPSTFLWVWAVRALPGFVSHICPRRPPCYKLWQMASYALSFCHFIGIRILSALVLCRLERSGGEALFLAVSHAEIFLLGLVLPLALFVQRAHRQQDMGVGIVSVCVMDSSVSAHSIGHKLFLYELPEQFDLRLPVNLSRQRNDANGIPPPDLQAVSKLRPYGKRTKKQPPLSTELDQ